MVALAVVAVLLAGCRLDLRTFVELDEDAGGVVTVDLLLDADAVARLDDAGVSLSAGLDDLDTPGWTLDELSGTALDDAADGAPRPAAGLRLRGEIEPDGLSRAIDQLQDGLDERTGRVLQDLDAQVVPSGRLRVVGDIGLELPGTIGFTGPGAPSRSDLLAAAGGEPRVLTQTVVLRGPSDVVALLESDGVVEDEQAVRWRFGPGASREVDVTFAAPSGGWSPVALGVITAGGVLLLGALVLLWLRRRRDGGQVDGEQVDGEPVGASG